MQGGCSIRGSNSSAARFSWHCGDAFIAVAPKKRAGKLSFYFFDVEFPLMAYALSFSTPRARLGSADGFGIKNGVFTHMISIFLVFLRPMGKFFGILPKII